MIAEWTESRIQHALATHFNKTGSLCVPNCGAFGWEADLIRILPSMIAYEYEIKISASDFRKDAAKTLKHLALNGDHPAARKKGRCAQRFYYVAPPGVILADRVPSHAGLITFWPNGKPKLVKRAPKLHDHKIGHRELLYVARGAAFRFWQSAKWEAINGAPKV